MKFKLNSDSTKLILKESSKEEFNQLKLYLNRYVKNYRFMPFNTRRNKGINKGILQGLQMGTNLLFMATKPY